MKEISVTCSHCGGTGSESLSPPLARTLERVPDDGTITTEEVYSRLQTNGNGDQYVTREAIAMRLLSLRKLQLIYEVERRSKTIHWRKVKAKKSK